MFLLKRYGCLPICGLAKTAPLFLQGEEAKERKIGVAGGIAPYFGVYQIIVLFFRGEPAARSILFWGAVCAAGYIVKILFYGIAMSLSHRCVYKILENIRLAIAGRLMRAVTLGKTAGSLKSTIVDKVETLELPLAHIIPEGISATAPTA